MNYNVFILLIATLLQSCSSMYIPSVRSIPLLEQAGEFQGEAGVSTNSVYANGSYAFSDKFAATVSGNLSYGNFTDSYDVFTNKNKTSTGSFYFGSAETGGVFSHRYGEVSLGRINMIQPTRTPKLEIFGGMGIGKATDGINRKDLYDCNYYSIFGQGNFGIKRRVVEVGGSVRLAYSLFDYNVNYDDNSIANYQDFFYAFHLEPMGFARVGGKNMKVVFRYGFNLPFSIGINENTKGLYGFNSLIGKSSWKNTTFHFSIGLSYRIKGK